MRKADSIMRQINRRLTEISGFFGMKSIEYQSIRALIGTIPGVEALMRFPKGTPLMSRTKRVIEQVESTPELKEKLEKVLEAILAKGSVREQARKYYASGVEPPKGKKLREHQDVIQELAEAAYESRYNDDDIYNKHLPEEEQEAARSEDAIYQAELEAIHKIFEEEPGKGNPAGKLEKWNRIKREFERAKDEHYERLVEDLSQDEEAQEAAKWADKILNPRKYDMSM